MNNAVIPTEQKARFSVAITTPQYQELIKSTLGDPARVRSFTAAITSAVSVNPALQECRSSSIIAGALLGESLNLSPSPQLGQYYLVPFETAVKDANGKKKWLLDENGNHLLDKNGKWAYESVKNAVFVLGYRGFIQLAIRSGNYIDIDSMEIKEGEYLGKSKVNGKPIFSFVEDDVERESRPTIGYMAYFEYTNGFTKTLYWSRDKMLSHADHYSPAFSAEAYRKLLNNEIPDNERWKYSSFWYTDFDSMAKKTMLRQLISKWGVMSADSVMATAYNADNHTIEADKTGFLTPSPDIDELKPATPTLPESNEYTGPVDGPPKESQTQSQTKQPKKINLSDV